MRIYLMCLLCIFTLDLNASSKRAVSSTSEIVNETDIKIFVDNRLQEIFNEKSYEKQKAMFSKLYSTVQSQVSSYDKALSDLYLQIEQAKDKKDPEIIKKSKAAASKQVFMGAWTEMLIAFEKPANLFLYNQESEELNCSTIERSITFSYLSMAPADSSLNPYAKKAVELSKLLCSKK